MTTKQAQAESASTSPIVISAQMAKFGHHDDECQDAIDASTKGALRVAVADGASLSSGPRLWAQLLTKLAVRQPPTAELVGARQDAWLEEARARWRDHHWRQAKSSSDWFNVQSAYHPAAATLLFVEFVESTPKHVIWRSLAIGDTCVLEYSSQAMLDGRPRGFPLTRGAQFNTRPALLSSHVGSPSEGPAWVTREGELAVGGMLALATDAVAKYLLETPGAGRRLAQLDDDASVRRYLAELAADERVEDDDLSLVLIRHRQSSSPQRDQRERVDDARGEDPASPSPIGRAYTSAKPKPIEAKPIEPDLESDVDLEFRPHGQWAQMVLISGVVSTITHISLGAIERQWLDPPAAEQTLYRDVPASPPSDDLDRRGSISMDLAHEADVIDQPFAWMCCSLQSCVVEETVVTVNATDIIARDDNSDSLGYFATGPHGIIETRPGSLLFPEIDCEQWCRVEWQRGDGETR